MNKPTQNSPLFMPKNEEELSTIESHVQSVLKNKIDINLTTKRKNKLRDLTCSLAGFNNGYQQLRTYWNDIIDESGVLFDVLQNALKNKSSNIRINDKNEKALIYLNINKHIKLERIIDSGQSKEIYNELYFINKNNNDSGFFEIYFGNYKYRIHINEIPTKNNISDFILKIEALEKPILPLNQIGLNNISKLKESLKKESGLIVVGGILESGKKDTLKSILNEVKENDDYNKNTVSFGEIRCFDDIKKIFNSINENKLVIASVHTNSLFGIVKRLECLSDGIIDINKYLICAVSQYLIPKKCSMCDGEKMYSL